MKAAFANWNQRIAPVFDVARRIHLVEIEDGQIVKESDENLYQDLAVQVAQHLVALGIETLICGAISQPLQNMIAAHGIQVIAFRSGDLREVITAWLSGELVRSDFYTMPGCGRHGYRQRRWTMVHHKEVFMFGRKRGGQGPGNGSGAGGGGRGGGRGRMGGPLAAGPDGECVCPQCGHREPHQRGVPCTEHKCPKCGIAMTRA